MCFHFFFCFLNWYSDRSYGFCNWIKNFAITVEIKKCKSIIKKKKKKGDKILLLAKSKLNSIKVLISKALIDSNITHDKFVLINNMLKKFYDMKEELKISYDK